MRREDLNERPCYAWVRSGPSKEVLKQRKTLDSTEHDHVSAIGGQLSARKYVYVVNVGCSGEHRRNVFDGVMVGNDEHVDSLGAGLVDSCLSVKRVRTTLVWIRVEVKVDCSPHDQLPGL
jgi:hypothetical protein